MAGRAGRVTVRGGTLAVEIKYPRAWCGVRGAVGEEPVTEAGGAVDGALGGAADPHLHRFGRDGRHDRLVQSIGTVGGHGLAGEETADDVQTGLEAGRAPGVVDAHPGELLLAPTDGAREDEPTGCERRQRADLLGDQYRVQRGGRYNAPNGRSPHSASSRPRSGEFW